MIGYVLVSMLIYYWPIIVPPVDLMYGYRPRSSLYHSWSTDRYLLNTHISTRETDYARWINHILTCGAAYMGREIAYLPLERRIQATSEWQTT